MKRKYRLLADNLGSVKRWRAWDAVPVAVFGFLIYQGYKGVDMETGALLIVVLAVSTMFCNPFGLLSWGMSPASRYCIATGVTMDYTAFMIWRYATDVKAYPLAVSGCIGVLLVVMGVYFRPRWLETWRKQEEKRRYQLSIFQCRAVDETIGQLKAGSETAALEAWEQYGNAQCRALLHQWAAVEITEDEIDHICFPVWILAHGSAFADRAELEAKHRKQLEKLEKEAKSAKVDLWMEQSEKTNAAYYEQERNEAQAEVKRLWAENQALKYELEETRALLDEATAEPEELQALEDAGHVVRMFPRPAPETMEDVEELEDVEEQPKAAEPPTIKIAGVAVPVDLQPLQLRDLRILEYKEAGHSQQECADHFGLNSRKTADSAIGRAKKLRDKLRKDSELEAVGC